MYIVAKIHNNSLGRAIEVDSEAHGKDIVREWAEDQFQRGLTDEEIENLENYWEIYDDSDPENVYAFSIAIVETA